MSMTLFLAIYHDVEPAVANQNSNNFGIFTSNFLVLFLQAVPFNTNLNFMLCVYKFSSDLIMVTSTFCLYSFAILVIFLSKQYLTLVFLRRTFT